MPVPVMGTVKITSSLGLFSISVASSGDGHWDGGVPGAHVSCGEKSIVTTQPCPESRTKGSPSDGPPSRPHASISEKLGAPLLLASVKVTPPRFAPEMLTSVIVWIVSGD